MSRAVSFFLVGLHFALALRAPDAGAVVPPRPGSGARAPDVAPELREAGFGLISRPLVPPPPAVEVQAGAAATAAAGATGVRALPVLLGDTADRAGAQNAAAFQELLFGSYPSGSMADYFREVSYGALTVTGTVSGWHRLPETMTYYEGAAGCNGLCAYPRSAGGFVRQLVQRADEAGFDWGPFDNDGPDGLPNSGDDDGYVDAVVVVHAGRGGECGGNNFIWSHSFFLRGWGTTAYTTRTARPGGGYLKVDDYIIQPEISCRGGLIEIGVFCHEYGHALGLPDLYDTSQGGGEGIGAFGLMGAGAWGGNGVTPETPVHPCAWSKQVLGWLRPQVVRFDGPQQLAGAAREATALKIWSAGAPGREYFLVENRQRELNDRHLPAGGLFVWHIDEAVIDAAWASNRVNAGALYGVALEQADGLDQLKSGANRGDAADPWPGSLGRTLFDETTLPSSRANDSTATGVALRDVSATAAVMTAQVVVGVPPDVTPPLVALLSPQGGETWAAGAMRTIAWEASDDRGVAAVDIFLSLDGGASWPDTVALGLASTGDHSWLVPSRSSHRCRLRLRAADEAGNTATAESGDFTVANMTATGDGPARLAVGPGYPNPFNPLITIRFDVPQPGPVEIDVFDLKGRRVRSLLRERREAGAAAVRWDGRGDRGQELPSGVYHVRVTAASSRASLQVTLLR